MRSQDTVIPARAEHMNTRRFLGSELNGCHFLCNVGCGATSSGRQIVRKRKMGLPPSERACRLRCGERFDPARKNLLEGFFRDAIARSRAVADVDSTEPSRLDQPAHCAPVKLELFRRLSFCQEKLIRSMCQR